MKIINYKLFAISRTIFFALAFFGNAMASELVIITSPDNAEEIKIEDVARIFLGKVTRFPSGDVVVPLNIHRSDPSYVEFARVVLRKNLSQLRAYWAKQVFTGKGRPPRTISTTEDLLWLVSKDRRYLSYLDRNNVNHTVRWLIEVEK
jgi:hypothetical protein